MASLTDDAASPLDLAGESAPLLLAIRHALADPLSGAALKLDLLERRLQSPTGAEPEWILERVRAMQGDVGKATRLLDLLLRVSEITAEPPTIASLAEVCRAASVELIESAVLPPLLLLRKRSVAESIRNVASFVTGPGGARAPRGRAAVENGRVSLDLEGPRATSDHRPERLLDLPHGIEEAEALFLARATAEADGGRLELSESGEVLVARFSWPVREAVAP